MLARMSELAPNELQLNGRIQVEMALAALKLTGRNKDSRKRLQTFLEIHDGMPEPAEQSPLIIFYSGDTVVQEKADIITSLGVLATSKQVPDDMRLAASALRDILQ